MPIKRAVTRPLTPASMAGRRQFKKQQVLTRLWRKGKACAGQGGAHRYSRCENRKEVLQNVSKRDGQVYFIFGAEGRSA